MVKKILTTCTLKKQHIITLKVSNLKFVFLTELIQKQPNDLSYIHSLCDILPFLSFNCLNNSITVVLFSVRFVIADVFLFLQGSPKKKAKTSVKKKPGNFKTSYCTFLYKKQVTIIMIAYKKSLYIDRILSKDQLEHST